MTSMASTDSNRMAQVRVDSSEANEAATLLDATIQQLRSSRLRLEAQTTLGQGDRDALIYLDTAEMHLKAARFRLYADGGNERPASPRSAR